MQFENERFLLDKITYAGFPKAFALDEERRYFQRRGQHGIVIQTVGEAIYHIISEGKTHHLKEGGLLFLPEHLQYEVFCPTKDGIGHRCMCINFLTINTVTSDSVMLYPKAPLTYSKLFNDIISVKNDFSGFDEYRLANLYMLISRFKRELAESTQSLSYGAKKRCAPAISYINEHPLDNIPVGELATLCGLKESFFRKSFHEATGVSPVTYRNNVRISNAVSLIQSGNMSLSEVAQNSGFDDYYYFCRLFKKIIGVSPGKFDGTPR